MADRPAELALAQKIVSSTEKLLHEVGRLRSDIAKLHARIEPFDNEPDFTASFSRPIRTMTEALAAIDESRQGVISAEYHLNAVRAGGRNAIWSASVVWGYVERQISVGMAAKAKLEAWLSPRANGQAVFVPWWADEQVYCFGWLEAHKDNPSRS